MPHDEHRHTRILIVDDHSIVRQGIAMMIGHELGLHACCEAADMQQALEANRACPHDLAIIDISLPDASGIDLAKKLLEEFPKLRILMLSMHDETVYAETALLAGAHGYLMKEAGKELPDAIQKILNGELYTSNSIHSILLDHTIWPTKPASHQRRVSI